VAATLGNRGDFGEHGIREAWVARIPAVVREDAEELARVRAQGPAAQVERAETQERAAERHAHHGVKGVLEVHLRGGRGYFDEKTGELVAEYLRVEQSPAIDAGDPASDFRNEPNCKIGYHGKRVNLGGYGNTPWATMTTKPGFYLLVR
jgi:hypothetical protein